MMQNREDCNCCGLCIQIAPCCFGWGEDGKAEVHESHPADCFYDNVTLAKESCPMQLIYVNM